MVLGLALASCSSSSPSSQSLDPKLAQGLKDQANGDNAQAVADYLAVVKKDPLNKLAWYNLGVIAHQAGQDDQAAKDFASSLQGDPNYVPALYNLAILQTPTNPKSAQQLYEKAEKLQPKDAKVHLNLGFLLQQMGQVTAGDEEISKAIQLDPSLASRVPKSTTTVPG